MDQNGDGVRRAQQLAGLGTWVLDLPTGEMSARPGMRALLQYDDDTPDPTLRDYVRTVHPDDQPALVANWRALVNDGTEYVDEHRLMLPDGSVKYVRAVACVERDLDGRAVRAVGITQDITAMKVASREYQRQRDLSRAILNSLREGYLLSRDGVILEVNGAFCDLTGYTADEVVGTGAPYPFWANEANTDLGELTTRLLAEGGGRADVHLLHKNGRPLDVHVTSTPLADGEHPSGIWLSVLRDTSEQRRYERILLSRAQTDPLTGLHNSRTFRDRLREAVGAASAGRPLTLALVDLDYFKRINDTHGHAVGDEVLRAVVNRFSRTTEGNFDWARVGGEEFALLMPATPVDAAHSILEAALAGLRNTPIPPAGTVTASAGIAQMTEPATDDSLFRAADALLYQAKAAGRDRCVSHPAVPTTSAD